MLITVQATITTITSFYISLISATQALVIFIMLVIIIPAAANKALILKAILVDSIKCDQ
jgi:hypothetical protein